MRERWPAAAMAAAAGLLAALSLVSDPAAETMQTSSVSVETTVIERFQPGSATDRFGQLQFVGGLELESPDDRLAGVSALRILNAGTRFLAVSDNGDWLSGEIARDAEGAPTGIADLGIGALPGADGAPLSGKGDSDAESLAIDGSRVLVGFERNHRILAYPAADSPFSGPPAIIDLPVPRAELRNNKGLETIAMSPHDSPLAGAGVAVAEGSVDANGNLFAAIFGGASNGVFAVRRDAAWEATDGAFLPGGDFLLLERRFRGLFGGIGVRIRRIAGDAFAPGAIVDGPVIFEASLAQEIDNMEGLDAWIDADGATRLTLVSDDNGSFFQRNLLLEFRLVGDGVTG